MKREGTWHGGIYNWGMKEGWAKLVWNPTLKNEVPQDVLQLVNEVQQKIISGELVVYEPKDEMWDPARWA